MSCRSCGVDKRWTCGKAGAAVNLKRICWIVCDIGEPCLSQSPIKVNKMLKPEKWQSTFDSDGKIHSFQKALKLILYGGVDPSIKAEVWEFLLGCYALGSTAEHRRQLRTARRERYEELVKQCQLMHSSIGTGSLAYVVGSRVMDMRASSKDHGREEAKIEHKQVPVDNINTAEDKFNSNDECTVTSYAHHSESSSDSDDLLSVRKSTDGAAYDSSCFVPTSSSHNCNTHNLGREAEGSQSVGESYFDFPLFVDLFGESDQDNEECDKLSSQNKPPELRDERMHSFRINNNEDLVKESKFSPFNNVSHPINSEIEIACTDAHEPVLRSNSKDKKAELINRLRISDVPETEFLYRTSPQGGAAGEDRVSEWLWTLHRIVVDVVRTDSHLEFYEDTRNLARMSDILAVYAWVDPSTGYCQGMSDLLSPFVILFEDDADAFWCFEMLLRRMRENFKIEGPTGVMKQLESLWHILELTDREIFAHLSHIGAESLHFAFPMLLVLFRRELSFNEALSIWEMMWAADFDEYGMYDLEESCLEPLVVQLPKDSEDESAESGDCDTRSSLQSNHGNMERSLSDNDGMKTASTYHFCGLSRNFFCSTNDRMQINAAISSAKKGEDELPVFVVAAILILNRHKIIRNTRSIDDMIKIFNDKVLKFDVKRCVRTAIKLRKKYLYKIIKKKSPAAQNGD